MGALVQLGQMAPAMNSAVISFLPNNALSALGGLGAGALFSKIAGALFGEVASAGERVLFEGGKAEFKQALVDGISGVSPEQARGLLGTLEKGSVDNVRLVTGENGLVSYSTRAGRNGYQTLVRFFDESGNVSRMAQAAWDRAGKLVHGEVWK